MRDTHKGNSHRRVRKGAASPLAAGSARTSALALGLMLAAALGAGPACSRSGTAGPADTKPVQKEEPAAPSPPHEASVTTTTTSGEEPAAASAASTGEEEAAAASPPAKSASGTPASCPKYGAPERLASITDRQLGEISGITVASKPGSFWVHNDSGDGPNVYLVTSAGKHTATFTFGPLAVTDVEDMARAPRAAGGSYLYLADIGDNLGERRDGVTILRAREPDVGAPPKLPTEIMRVTYPGGPANAEAFLVDPRSGEIVIVTKHPLFPARVLVSTEFLPMTRMRELGSITPESSGQAVAFVTGAAVSDDGNFALLRTYEAAYLFTRHSDQTLGEALLGPACRIETAPEKQGEAIAFMPRAPGSRAAGPPPLVTVSEGSPTTIWQQTPE